MNRTQLADRLHYLNREHSDIWVLFGYKLVCVDNNGKKYSIFKQLREV